MSKKKIRYINAWDNEIEVNTKGKTIMDTEKVSIKGVSPLEALEIAKANSVELHLNCNNTEAIKVAEAFDFNVSTAIIDLAVIVGDLVKYTVLDTVNQALKRFLKGKEYSAEEIAITNYCNNLTIVKYEEMSDIQKLIFEDMSKGAIVSSIAELEDKYSTESFVELFNEDMGGSSPSHTAFQNNLEGVSDLKEYANWSDDEFYIHLTDSDNYKSSDDVIVHTTDDEVYSLSVYQIKEMLTD